MTIDLERCRKGMAQLDVEGIPRNSLIEEAISAIQRDATAAFRERYFGIKNYASFGDQREDYAYSTGPAHGSIVFSIGLTNERRGAKQALDGDAIYYLEAYRDFGAIEWPAPASAPSYQRTIRLTLGAAIRIFDQLTAKLNKLADAFAATAIEAHV